MFLRSTIFRLSGRLLSATKFPVNQIHEAASPAIADPARPPDPVAEPSGWHRVQLVREPRPRPSGDPGHPDAGGAENDRVGVSSDAVSSTSPRPPWSFTGGRAFYLSSLVESGLPWTFRAGFFAITEVWGLRLACFASFLATFTSFRLR